MRSPLLLASSLLLTLSCRGKDVESATPTETGATTDSLQPTDTADPTESETGITDTGWDPRFDEVVAQLDAELAASDAPGVSIAILEKGEVVLALGRGSAHPDQELPVSPDTLFQIGSTTKMLTSIATLQKVEDGEFSLEDSLAHLYPASEFSLDDSWNDRITVEHLLTHQGAFYDYLEWWGSPEDEDLQAWHEEIFFPYLFCMNTPGSFFNYSNPNFDIAGLLVEAHDSRWYPDIIAEDIFAPLGMDRSLQRLSQVEADGDYALGVGYTAYADGSTSWGDVLLPDVPDPAHARPAGAGTWTTPTQMLEVARFFMEGNPEVLSDELREQMTTYHLPTGYYVDDVGYGYGWFVHPGFDIDDDYYVTPVWQHGGNTLSYSSELWVLPEQELAVSILSSGYGTYFRETVQQVLALASDLPEPIPEPEWEVDPAAFDAHVGTYNDLYNLGELIITREGNSLHVEAPLLDAYGFDVEPVLEPLSSELFLIGIDGYAYDVLFIPETEGGPSTWVRNRAFVATRVEESSAQAAAPSAVHVARRLEEARRSTHLLSPELRAAMQRPR